MGDQKAPSRESYSGGGTDQMKHYMTLTIDSFVAGSVSAVVTHEPIIIIDSEGMTIESQSGETVKLSWAMVDLMKRDLAHFRRREAAAERTK